jgi:hypothetical protein
MRKYSYDIKFRQRIKIKEFSIVSYEHALEKY